MSSTISCPTCHQQVIWCTKNRYRPFCSQRCHLIDLGEWVSEQKVIPGDKVSPPLDPLSGQ